MGEIIKFRRRKTRNAPRGWLGVLAALAVGIALGLYLWPLDLRLPLLSLSPQTPSDVMTDISVIDGDTVRSGGHTYRLVGFDTPERGDLAHCDSERTLTHQATERLQQLIDAGHATLERITCACKPGTEGTRRCNYGRLCGTLRADGQDVGPILIREGLAHPYVCSGTHCPRRQGWCG
jgi:endonuclease YncB( thermonuclease family)